MSICFPESIRPFGNTTEAGNRHRITFEFVSSLNLRASAVQTARESDQDLHIAQGCCQICKRKRECGNCTGIDRSGYDATFTATRDIPPEGVIYDTLCGV